MDARDAQKRIEDSLNLIFPSCKVTVEEIKDNPESPTYISWDVEVRSISGRLYKRNGGFEKQYFDSHHRKAIRDMTIDFCHKVLREND